MDWNMIGAISTASMAVVILCTAIFAVLQLKEVSRSRKVTAFMNLSQFLQQQEIREARGALIQASGKDLKDWSQDEIKAAEKACSSYDVAGIMVSRKLIERDLIVNEWRDSIIKCWEAAKPMIIEYRRNRGEDFWNDFGSLYEMALKIGTVHKKE